MNVIKSIDLWTEQIENHIECFCGAFVDGFENNNIPFNTYKVIKNGNCIITCEQEIFNITNKHNAIVFYKNNFPVRLMVINKNTDIDRCINIALCQKLNQTTLSKIYQKNSIRRYDIDLKQQPIYNAANKNDEIDVGSCDRQSLLDSMLEGCYTQSETNYGKNNSNNSFNFVTDIFIKYDFATDTEKFIIEHSCAYLNETETRIIPLQDNSSLNIESIKEKELHFNSPTKRRR